MTHPKGKPQALPGQLVVVNRRAGGRPIPEGGFGRVLPPGHMAEWDDDPAAQVIAVQNLSGQVYDATEWEVLDPRTDLPWPGVRPSA